MAFPRPIAQVLFDVFCYLIVSLPTALGTYVIKPVHQGFYCDDESIRFAYREDTVSTLLLAITTVFCPVLTIFLIESLYYSVRKAWLGTIISLDYHITKTCSVPIYVSNFYKVFGIFIFGMAATASITFLGKCATGRLRPHFIDTCRPDWSLINCTQQNYVEEYVCTKNSNTRTLWDARQSFPSGHASSIFFFAIYFSFYLRMRITNSFANRLVYALQLMLLCAAVYVSMSRVTDYRHFWSDVFAGAILGIVFGVFAGLHLSSVLRESDGINLQVRIPNLGPSNSKEHTDTSKRTTLQIEKDDDSQIPIKASVKSSKSLSTNTLQKKLSRPTAP